MCGGDAPSVLFVSWCPRLLVILWDAGAAVCSHAPVIEQRTKLQDLHDALSYVSVHGLCQTLPLPAEGLHRTAYMCAQGSIGLKAP